MSAAGEVRIVGGTRIRIVRTAEEIRGDVERIASSLRGALGGEAPIFIGILKGCFILLADLVRAYEAEHEIEFLSLTRIKSSRKDSTSVRVLHDLGSDIRGRQVIVVEGIRTRGTKIEYVDRFLRLHEPAGIRYAALARQRGAAEGPIPLDALGFEIGDHYVVGYGLDLEEQYRDLPFIGMIEGAAAAGPGR